MGSFGTYTLHEQLGSGTRGVVHRATIWDDDETLRSVAIKLIPLSLFDSVSAAERCAAEIARAVQLRHPNIVTTRRAGTVGDTAYVEMEHVAGTSVEEILHDVFTGGPPPIPVVTSLLAELCDALEFAHQRGVAHGDIRPGHLLVDSAGHLRVLGFGLSQLDQPLSQRSYAAPETFDAGGTDARADLFSIGVIAYELVTGRPLFGEQMDPHVRSYVGARAAPPSHCNPTCPPVLDEVILRAIAIEPGERWVAARDMRIALAHIGGPEPELVANWLREDGDREYQRTSIALPLPPGEPRIPPPPRRMARGSGRLPSPNDATPTPTSGADLHEALTELHTPTGSGPRHLKLPLDAQAQAHLVIEEDEDFEDVEYDDVSIVEVTPELELGEWPAPAATQTAAVHAGRFRTGRIVELSIAFVAGAAAMYLVGQLLG